MKTLVLWDWDGTIADSEPAVTAALRALAQKYALPPVTQADVTDVMNHHFGAFWHNAFGADFHVPFLYFLDQIQAYNRLKKPVIFAGIVETLTYLKQQGIAQMVASNKPQYLLDEECAAAGLTPFFVRVCGTDVNRPEQKPDVLYGQMILKGLTYDRLLMIGDGAQDMTFARNMGAEAWYVRRERLPDVPYDLYLPSQRDILPAVKVRFGV